MEPGAIALIRAVYDSNYALQIGVKLNFPHNLKRF